MSFSILEPMVLCVTITINENLVKCVVKETILRTAVIIY